MGMNLYQKLLEIRKSVPYLQKDAQGYQFTYVSSSKVLGSLKGKMDEMKVLLIPSITAKEVGEHTTKKGDKEKFTELTMCFTWVDADNPTDRIECLWYAQGLDNGEKGVGKAVTYAEKYFLLKFFNIATDKDDPDSFQAKYEEAVPMMNGGQVNNIKQIIKDKFLTKDQAKNACINSCGKTDFPTLTESDADKYIAALKALPANQPPAGQTQPTA